MGGSGPDVYGTVMSDGHNLIGETDSSSSGITNGTNGDQAGTIATPLNPLLGTLSSNGGTTQTIPLLPGSPAINAGAAVGSGPMGNTVPATDQRGDARVGAPDIGAFEVQGFTLVVNSTADGTANAGNCAAGNSNLCRLRDAIAAVTPGNSTITFDAAVFPFSTNTPTLIRLSAGTLTLSANVTIDGTGRTVIVDGGCTFSGGVCTSNTGVGVFAVNRSVTASLTALTIQHGNTTGGIGGGIYNNISSTLTLTNSTITGNSATLDGGGIYNNGTATVTNSTFSGNSSSHIGGGIYNNSIGTMTLTNTTITGNSTNGGDGGGIYNNPPGMFAGGIVTLTNTIVAGNTATGSGPDLNGAITSGGRNLIGKTDSSSSGITNGTKGDIVNNMPLLGTLSSNGGPTPTIPLLPGSPAIAHGDTTVCNATTGTAPVNGKDQRGSPRQAAVCSIGAFEPQNAAYTVGSLSDSDNAGTLAACQSATNTTCRLRDALALAPSAYDTETITFNGTGNGKITLTSRTLTVAGNVTITGPTSGAGVIVDGGCTFNGTICTSGTGVTVFTVNPGVTVGISNLTIQHGHAVTSNGSGIYNNGGMVTLTNSTITGNVAPNSGGGIYNVGGTMTLTNSTLSGNSASKGGGIYNNFMAR